MGTGNRESGRWKVEGKGPEHKVGFVRNGIC